MNPLIQGLSDLALESAIAHLSRCHWLWPDRLKQLRAEHNRRETKHHQSLK